MYLPHACTGQLLLPHRNVNGVPSALGGQEDGCCDGKGWQRKGGQADVCLWEPPCLREQRKAAGQAHDPQPRCWWPSTYCHRQDRCLPSPHTAQQLSQHLGGPGVASDSATSTLKSTSLPQRLTRQRCPRASSISRVLHVYPFNVQRATPMLGAAYQVAHLKD